MKDGGPAFPNEGFNGWGEPFQGMTLRDYFAAKAMQAILQGKTAVELSGAGYTAYAILAYAQADSMLKAREK